MPALDGRSICIVAAPRCAAGENDPVPVTWIWPAFGTVSCMLIAIR